jgi:hypothetical protein
LVQIGQLGTIKPGKEDRKTAELRLRSIIKFNDIRKYKIQTIF